MKILYDHQIFALQNYGGISRYFVELTEHIAQLPNTQIQNTPLKSANAHLRGSKVLKSRKISNIQTWLMSLRFPGKNRLQRHLRQYQYNRMAALALKTIAKGEFDIFHPTYYDDYFIETIRRIEKPYVLTVYDMIHERFPHLFSDEADEMFARRRKLLHHAAGIIAISQSTKDDIIRYYDIAPKKIKVIYLASSLTSIQEAPAEQQTDSYILFVGNRSHYKNFPFFLQSIRPLFDKYPMLKLLLLGGGTLTSGETAFIANLGLYDRVEQKTFSTDHELRDYYARAMLFVFPSLYEGFGIPILEAFASKCPLVCSDSSSFPEVADNGARYFSPDDAGSILHAVRSVLSNMELREKLVTNGTKRLLLFSWTNTATKTFAYYDQCIRTNATPWVKN